jgi:tetratricopeptide (TPR) repeat protein
MLSPAHKTLLDRPFEHKNKGNHQEAIDTFKESIRRFGESSVSVAMIAMIFQSILNQPAEALSYARRSVRLAPQSELASINLVHCLFDLGLHEELEREISRYLALGKTFEHYDVLFEENGLKREDFK